MTRRREGQRGFGQVVLFGLLGPPETLLDPALRRIDGLLDDEALVDAVWRALRSRYPQSAGRGGAAAPAGGGVRGVGGHTPTGWGDEPARWGGGARGAGRALSHPRRGPVRRARRCDGPTGGCCGSRDGWCARRSAAWPPRAGSCGGYRPRRRGKRAAP